MYSKIFTILVVYFAVAECNDIRIGFVSPRSRLIYNEIKEANPAIWTRTDDVEIHASHNEVIDAIYVTDLREDKDGNAYIEKGGVGTKSVTIRIESPNIFRGYKFKIEVYANNPNEAYGSKGVPQQYYGDTQFARKY